MPQLTPVSIVRTGEEAADLLVVGGFQGGSVTASEAPRFSRKTAAAVRRAAADFRGRSDEVAHAELRSAPVGRVRLVGLGAAKKLDQRSLGRVLDRVVELAGTDRVQTLAIALPAHPLTREPTAVRKLLRERRIELEMGGRCGHVRRPAARAPSTRRPPARA